MASDSSDSDSNWSLDSLIDSSGWTAAVRAGLETFAQGMLVPTPPLHYYAHAGHPLTHTTAAWKLAYGLSQGPVAPLARPPFGLILTQTCDLVEADARSPKRPWFELCSVYFRVCSDGEAAAIRDRKRLPYLLWVSGLPAREEGLWVADLRLTFSVEKTWLVGKAPLNAFADAAGQHALIQCLARPARPALPAGLDDFFILPLARLISQLGRSRGGDAGVDEIRYEAGRDRLDPDFVQAVLLSDAAVDDDVRAAIESDWTDRYEQTGCLIVLAPRFELFSDIDPRDYERLLRIDLDDYLDVLTEA